MVENLELKIAAIFQKTCNFLVFLIQYYIQLFENKEIQEKIHQFGSLKEDSVEDISLAR